MAAEDVRFILDIKNPSNVIKDPRKLEQINKEMFTVAGGGCPLAPVHSLTVPNTIYIYIYIKLINIVECQLGKFSISKNWFSSSISNRRSLKGSIVPDKNEFCGMKIEISKTDFYQGEFINRVISHMFSFPYNP